MKREAEKEKANNAAINAHCTIMMRAATTAKADLDRQKRATCRPVKTSTRYIAHPAIEDKWNASQLAKAQRAKETAEMEAQKATEEALREARIQMEIQTRTFSSACFSFFHFNQLIFCRLSLVIQAEG
jgi:hypothetical protein